MPSSQCLEGNAVNVSLRDTEDTGQTFLVRKDDDQNRNTTQITDTWTLNHYLKVLQQKWCKTMGENLAIQICECLLNVHIGRWLTSRFHYPTNRFILLMAQILQCLGCMNIIQQKLDNYLSTAAGFPPCRMFFEWNIAVLYWTRQVHWVGSCFSSTPSHTSISPFTGYFP